LKYAFGHFYGIHTLCEQRGAEWSFAGRLENDCTPGGERRRNFSNRQNEGEIPWANRANNADRSFDDQMSFSFDLMRDEPPISAAGFLGEPGQVIHRHGDFTFALSERFAVFECNDASDFIATAMQFGGNLLQQFPALFTGQIPPCPESGVCVMHRLCHLSATNFRHPAYYVAFGRIGDVVSFLGNPQLAVEVDRISFHLICAINSNDLAIFDGAFGCDGEQCAINAIVHAGERLPFFENTSHKFLVDLVEAKMVSPSFSVPSLDFMNDRVFLIFSTLPLQNFNSRNSAHEHATVSNDAHFQVFAGKIQSEHAELKRAANAVYIFETHCGMVIHMVLAFNDTVDGAAAKS
jgi:hypothetical protein